MQVKDVIEKLCTHPEFKEWEKGNKECYLVHVFKMLDEANENIWQVGYYDKKKDRITSFYIEHDDIKVIPEEEVYKKEKKAIKRLDMNEVRVNMREALDISNKLLKEEYEEEQSMKTILILQNIDEGLVWNITFVTHSFKTLNVKVDANKKKIIKHELTPLMEFKAG